MEKIFLKKYLENVSDKWLSYFPIYSVYFSKFKNKKINLLEIGIQNGDSLEIWLNYFKSANFILGSDIDSKCKNLNFKNISRINKSFTNTLDKF